MRYFSLLLVSLLALGCGTPGLNHDPANHDPRSVIVFSPPAIATLTPGSVPVDSVPFIMTVNGSNFNTDAIAFWQGVPQSTVFVTSNQLMVRVTDVDLMFTGFVPIYVRTAGQTSNTVDFSVTPQ